MIPCGGLDYGVLSILWQRPYVPGLYKCETDKKHFLLCLTQQLKEEKVCLHAIYTYVSHGKCLWGQHYVIKVCLHYDHIFDVWMFLHACHLDQNKLSCKIGMFYSNVPHAVVIVVDYKCLL